MKKSFLTLFVCLALLLSACNGAAATPTSTPTLPPTNTPIPATPTTPPTATPTKTPIPATPTPTWTPAPPIVFSTDLVRAPKDFSSLEMTVSMKYDGIDIDDKNITGNLDAKVGINLKTSELYVTASGTGTGNLMGLGDLLGGLGSGAGGGAIEMYLTGGEMYMNIMGSWLMISAKALSDEPLDKSLADSIFKDYADISAWLKSAKYVGMETVNGVPTHHFSYDQSNLDLTKLPEGMVIDKASGDLFVAVEGSYIVRSSGKFSGKNLGTPGTTMQAATIKEGNLEYTNNLISLNKLITVKIPDTAKEGVKPPADIPVLSGSVQIAGGSIMGFTIYTFTTEKTPQDAATFYKAELVKQGWKLSKSDETGEQLSFSYTKDARSMELSIGPDATTGKNTINIMLTGG